MQYADSAHHITPPVC